MTSKAYDTSPEERRVRLDAAQNPRYVRDSTCAETGLVDTSGKGGRCLTKQDFADRAAQRKRARERGVVFGAAVGLTFNLVAAAGVAYAINANERSQLERRASSAARNGGPAKKK
jgi:hypothetical protein